MYTRKNPSHTVQKILQCARGDIPADLVLKNGKIINVFTGELVNGDIAICNGHIAGIGKYESTKQIQLDGQYICPGLIDGHIHIESSLLEPAQFAKAVLPHGTTTVICDPHEIANVAGIDGIKYILDSANNLALEIYAMVPACVPATDMETAGAEISTVDMIDLLSHPKVLGLAEVMNFPGTVSGDPGILEKIKIFKKYNLPIDGHAPGLTGKNLQAYCAAGITSDHECTTLQEAQEKLRSGMYIYIREGSTAKNLADLHPLINSKTAHLCLLVSDDLHPDDIIRAGHMDATLKKAVSLGIDPVTAIQLVTINPARRFGLHDLGAIAPGFRANLVTFQDLENFQVKHVFTNGMQSVVDGKMLSKANIEIQDNVPTKINHSVHTKWKNIDFTVAVKGNKINVIELVPNQLITRKQILKPTISNNTAVADPSRDLLKIAVIERHKKSGQMSVGFIKGFGLKGGAIASSIAHDSHNIIVIGTNDEEMLIATKEITQINGGLAVIENHRVWGSLSLPIAGLMSNKNVTDVAKQLNSLQGKIKSLGCALDSPIMALSFLALPVIPDLKITDKGLVDVNSFQFTSLWV